LDCEVHEEQVFPVHWAYAVQASERMMTPTASTPAGQADKRGRMCALSKQVAESLEASAFCAVPSMMRRHNHQHTHCMLHAVAEEGAEMVHHPEKRTETNKSDGESSPFATEKTSTLTSFFVFFVTWGHFLKVKVCLTSD